MRLSIVAVGRLKSGPESDLAARYRDRFDASGRNLGLGPLQVTELPESRAAKVAARKKDEAERLLARCTGASLITLDEHGRSLDSKAFAALIARHRDDGVGELAFLIGGPDGHASVVNDKASMCVSLGAMTLPHGLARVVLLEQLYRATTILSGHPYHRD